MRLIDADALMKEFADFVRDSNNSDFADVPTWNDAVSLVGSAPTIEPERKKGKWIEITDHETPVVCKCTECGWLTTHYDSFSFCPNCGADMREET